MITLTTPPPSTATVQIQTLKAQLRATWMDGNYDYFSRFMESGASEFVDRLKLEPGTTFLDVGCGSGQLALIAARRGTHATGVDVASNLIVAARGRAAAEALDIRFDDGDAEALPCPEFKFDVVASMFGAMFAPRPELVAAELARVCRPGGTLALANWTKEGFIGQMSRKIAQYIAPPGMPSPLLWGDEAEVRIRLEAYTETLEMRRVFFRFEYPFSPAQVVEFFRQNYGPAKRAFCGLDDTRQNKLTAELTALWAANNLSSDALSTIVDAEYLEVVGTTPWISRPGT